MGPAPTHRLSWLRCAHRHTPLSIQLGVQPRDLCEVVRNQAAQAGYLDHQIPIPRIAGANPGGAVARHVLTQHGAALLVLASKERSQTLDLVEQHRHTGSIRTLASNQLLDALTRLTT